jgi:hypothetical protein
MTETLFHAENAEDGGYIASAVGATIVTEADDLSALREAVRGAVQCHFDEVQRPVLIRLHFAHDEVIAA